MYPLLAPRHTVHHQIDTLRELSFHEPLLSSILFLQHPMLLTVLSTRPRRQFLRTTNDIGVRTTPFDFHNGHYYYCHYYHVHGVESNSLFPPSPLDPPPSPESQMQIRCHSETFLLEAFPEIQAQCRSLSFKFRHVGSAERTTWRLGQGGGSGHQSSESRTPNTTQTTFPLIISDSGDQRFRYTLVR